MTTDPTVYDLTITTHVPITVEEARSLCIGLPDGGPGRDDPQTWTVRRLSGKRVFRVRRDGQRVTIA